MDKLSTLYQALETVQAVIDLFDAMGPEEQTRVLAAAQRFVEEYNAKARVSTGTNGSRFVVLYDWDEAPSTPTARRD